jgi:mRNA-degrading endonuclease toxin of MazEF toxin-antitoxin module
MISTTVPIVMPMIIGLTVDVAKLKNVPATWVRVISQGAPGSVLVEQLRYVDRSRCGAQIDELVEWDLNQVQNRLKQLLFQ